MNYLVTGGAGHIGSHVVDALLGRGDSVLVVDNLSTGKKANLNPRAQQLLCSVLDMKHQIPGDQKFDGLFHLAAYVNVREGTKTPSLMAENGANLTAAALELARDLEIPKFVFASSVVVEYNPRIPYGLEKEMGERYCRYYSERYGLGTCIVRLHSVYGSPRHDLVSGNVIPSFIEQKKKAHRLQVSGDGSQVRDFVYYTDVVGAILEAENREGLTEIGTGIGHTILEAAKYFACPIDFIGRPSGEVDRQVCKKSDYETKMSFEEGMRKTMSQLT